jgi:hypothetical protein
MKQREKRGPAHPAQIIATKASARGRMKVCHVFIVMTWLLRSLLIVNSVEQICSLVRGYRKEGVGARASMEVGVRNQGLSLKKVVG